MSTQVAELNQLVEELESKLKMATSQLVQLQAEHAKVVSEAIASPCNSGSGTKKDSKSNRQSPEQSESAEEAHIGSEDQIAVTESSSEDAKTPEDKKAESAKINSESQYPDSGKLISLENEVCAYDCFYMHSNNLISSFTRLLKWSYDTKYKVLSC